MFVPNKCVYQVETINEGLYVYKSKDSCALQNHVTQESREMWKVKATDLMFQVVFST